MQCHLSCLKSYFDPEAMIVFIHLMLVFILLVQQVGDTGLILKKVKLQDAGQLQYSLAHNLGRSSKLRIRSIDDNSKTVLPLTVLPRRI